VEVVGVEAEDDEEFEETLESCGDGSPTSPESGDSIVTRRQEALQVRVGRGGPETLIIPTQATNTYGRTTFSTPKRVTVCQSRSVDIRSQELPWKDNVRRALR